MVFSSYYMSLRKRLIGPAVVLLLSMAGVVARGQPQASPPSPPVETAPVDAVSRSGIPKFGEVTPFLYRGGQPSRAGFEWLAQQGIAIVVDLRGNRGDERRLVDRLGMQYVPMPWHCPFPRNKIFARFLRLLRDNPGKKVFVHCRLGDDRAGMMIAAYRMAEQGWTADQAWKEMRSYGVDFWHYFLCPTQRCYEKDFPRRFQNDPEFRELRSGSAATAERGKP